METLLTLFYLVSDSNVEGLVLKLSISQTKGKAVRQSRLDQN